MPSATVSPVDRLITLPAGQPDLTLGWVVAKWAMTYLRQPNGNRAKQPFRPVESQIRFWLWWYSVDTEGRWLFHRAVRRLAKGSGKSPFAAVNAFAELCGPVRLNLDVFDGTQASIDLVDRHGNPLGCKPVEMPLVQIVATSEAQTENTMRMVRAFGAKDSRLVKEYGLNPGREQYFLPPEGTLQQRTSSATTAEGAEASFIVGDETEHWKPGNNGDFLAATLLDNLAKSGSRLLETCNAWVPGGERQQSVAETSFNAWVAQEEGLTKGETKILYDARIAPPETNMDDRESLRAALDFVYDDCYWANKDAIIGRIYDTSSKRADSIRKYLNRPSAADDAWTTKEQFELLSDPTKVVADGEAIAMFFDGSKSRDATGLMGCRMSDGHMFVLGCYEPNPSHDSEDEVPAATVDGWVAKAFATYDPVGFFGDVREWESFTKLSWPEKYADRLLISAVPSGKEPQPIAWDMRSRSYDFGIACELTETEINDGGFTHDGSSVLTRHVINAHRRPNQFGNTSIGKESTSSPKKIDLAVCMVGARMVRRLVLASPAWQKRQRKGSGKGRVIVLTD